MSDKERLEQAEEWVTRNITNLRQLYAGEWIAVMDGQVLDHDKDSYTLSVRLSEWDNSFAYRAFIHKQDAVDLWDKIRRVLDGEL